VKELLKFVPVCTTDMGACVDYFEEVL